MSLLLCVACGEDVVLIPYDGGQPDSGQDAGRDGGIAEDASVQDAEPDDAGGPPRCEDGTVARSFAAAEPAVFDGIAGSFTAELLDGSRYTLSAQFSGCDSYVFLNRSATADSASVWNSFADPMFAESARNVHYFFTSDGTRIEARERVEEMRLSVEESFSRLSPEEADFWRERVHFVATPTASIEGSIGALVRRLGRAPTAFAIDRGQRFDPVGSLSLVSSGGFVSRLRMAAYASHYFNYRHALAQRVADEDASGDWREVVLLDREAVTDREQVLSAELPALDRVDHVDVDVQLHCRQGAQDCSEWDRIAALYVCDDAECTSPKELVRWITPYARPGRRRWTMDATRLRPLLSEGTNTFRLVLGPTWEEATERDVRVAIRLREGAAPQVTRVVPLYRGGTFDATYAENHPPIETAASDASRVELVVTISGHGQTDGANCAEWCNHVHRFQVGTSTHEVSFPTGIGEPFGCAERASEGVIPGQFGNWAPLRAGWCPGAPVTPFVFDVTDAFRGDGPDIRYDASYAGGTPRGGSIELSSYLVFYD